ncbi:MAG: glutathione S-transferase family protein, partial [Alphaproteobacteria bacterium]|nr:glutathione S-transferase family protein [Alphaproteobacteria bacterium]
MKLYMHPVSTTSRPVLLFMADNAIEAENVVIDLMAGEHMSEAFGEINPNHLVPVLEDGDFRLTESSAILKYLADKIGSPAYPKDLQARAKVNAAMDWLNADFYRDWGYGLVYPQIFPHHQRQSDGAQTATIDWARERSRGRLDVLDRDWIGPNQAYLCGDDVTIADYFGMGIFSLGEVV